MLLGFVSQLCCDFEEELSVSLPMSSPALKQVLLLCVLQVLVTSNAASDQLLQTEGQLVSSGVQPAGWACTMWDGWGRRSLTLQTTWLLIMHCL